MNGCSIVPDNNDGKHSWNRIIDETEILLGSSKRDWGIQHAMYSLRKAEDRWTEYRSQNTILVERHKPNTRYAVFPLLQWQTLWQDKVLRYPELAFPSCTLGALSLLALICSNGKLSPRQRMRSSNQDKALMFLKYKKSASFECPAALIRILLTVMWRFIYSESLLEVSVRIRSRWAWVGDYRGSFNNILPDGWTKVQVHWFPKNRLWEGIIEVTKICCACHFLVFIEFKLVSTPRSLISNPNSLLSPGFIYVSGSFKIQVVCSYDLQNSTKVLDWMLVPYRIQAILPSEHGSWPFLFEHGGMSLQISS